LQHIL